MAIQIREEAGVRYLQFGSRFIQGAMRIARPYALELEYTRDMMVTLLLRGEPRWPRNVLLIGLGAGSLAKFLYRNRRRSRLTVVEIDDTVPTAAWTFFKLPADPDRLTIEISEAHDYLARSRQRFDLMLVDGFDARGRAGMLDTLPFYCNCRAHLHEHGVLATNLMSRTRGVQPSLERLRAAFDGRALAMPPCESGNSIGVAAVGDWIHLPLRELNARARKLKMDAGLNLLPLAARIAASGIALDDSLTL